MMAAATGVLTMEQRAAATQMGAVLVLAGAGTGKTKTLTAAVVHRIQVRGIAGPGRDIHQQGSERDGRAHSCRPRRSRSPALDRNLPRPRRQAIALGTRDRRAAARVRHPGR